jgi:hypothetical protein
MKCWLLILIYFFPFFISKDGSKMGIEINVKFFFKLPLLFRTDTNKKKKERRRRRELLNKAHL